jgi:Fe-S-cluster containining protein
MRNEYIKAMPDVPAGDFASWLRSMRNSIMNETATTVDCRECIACCSSFQFVHLRPEETATLERIPKDIPVAAPGLPKGHVLLGYDRNGFCPMIVDTACSIYEYRPRTCRTYDCRVFTAAGISAGEDKPRINERIQRWKFAYPSGHDLEAHLAVQASAKFIRTHAEHFPGGRIPENPGQLAIVAIKVYNVFLHGKPQISDSGIANSIVEAARAFDARMERCLEKMGKRR